MSKNPSVMKLAEMPKANRVYSDPTEGAGTMFCGHKTGFNPAGNNKCLPNPLGPPATKFGGRPAVPAGPLKRFPGSAGDATVGNRRLAKTINAFSGPKDGADGVDGVTFRGYNAFSANQLNPKGIGGKVSKTYDTKGGSGLRKGRKT
jgi:hypothetical protein